MFVLWCACVCIRAANRWRDPVCRMGGCYLIKIADAGDDLVFKHYYFVFIAGLRSFDMMSDWAFFALSLALNSDFHRR